MHEWQKAQTRSAHEAGAGGAMLALKACLGHPESCNCTEFITPSSLLLLPPGLAAGEAADLPRSARCTARSAGDAASAAPAASCWDRLAW